MLVKWPPVYLTQSPSGDSHLPSSCGPAEICERLQRHFAKRRTECLVQFRVSNLNGGDGANLVAHTLRNCFTSVGGKPYSSTPQAMGGQIPVVWTFTSLRLFHANTLTRFLDVSLCEPLGFECFVFSCLLQQHQCPSLVLRLPPEGQKPLTTDTLGARFAKLLRLLTDCSRNSRATMQMVGTTLSSLSATTRVVRSSTNWLVSIGAGRCTGAVLFTLSRML